METLTCTCCGSDRPFGKPCTACPHGSPSEQEVNRAEHAEEMAGQAAILAALTDLRARERRTRYPEARFVSKEAAGRALTCRSEEINRLIAEGRLLAVPHGKRDMIPVAELGKFDETGIPPPIVRPAKPTVKRAARNGTARSAEEVERAIRAIKVPRDG